VTDVSLPWSPSEQSTRQICLKKLIPAAHTAGRGLYFGP
jgi:hypothetical protein